MLLAGDETFSVLTAASDTFVAGERTFGMLEEVPTGITVKAGENTFDVSHVITEAEAEKYDDTTTEDIGKVFEEKVTIAGDDSYTVDNMAFGVSIVSGLSNGASVEAAVVFDGIENEYGTGFKFVTDEEGTFNFGGTNYTITGDNNVTLDVDFNADGTAVLASISGLDEGATVIPEGAFDNNTDSVNIALDTGETLTNAGDNVTIEGAGDNQIENTGSNNVINVSGGDNEISNSGEGTTIISGSGADSISNTGANDVYIDAGDGDNSILVKEGDGATVIAGAGDDTIANDTSDDVYISAGAGDNSIASACDNVTVVSEGGNDTITAEGSNTSITAGDGDNYIISTGDNVTITSGSGNDTITNVNGNADYIDAGDGDNQIFNGLLYTVDSSADTLENYYESETVITGSGDDTIDNYGGYYVQISTGDGSDSIRSYHSYYNTIEAGAGDDKIILQNGHYQNVDAGEGNDTIIGSVASGSGDWATGGHATLLGGEGDDYINPSYANDSYIEGGAGNDTIISRGPRQTIDAGEGNDIVSLGSANASESRTETTTENLIITSGSDTIYGYESTSTIQSAEILSTELSGKDVILTTDEGTITVVKGAGQIINVNGEQIATGEFEVTDGEPLEYNGMTFTGSGKVTLAGDVPTLGAGVAVTGANDVVMTDKGVSTVNGQSFWLTEKVAAGVTVSTIEDGISVAHVIIADDVPEAESDVCVGRIFKEEAYVYGDDEYLVRLDAGGLRSIFGLSTGTTVEGKGHTETAIGSDEYKDDYSVLQLGLSEAGTYTFGGKDYTIGELTSDTPVGVNVRYETDDTTAITFVRYLNGNTISGDFSSNAVSVGSDKVAQVVSISGDDSVSITGGRKSASVISGVSDGATLYSGGGATKFTTDEEGSFYLVNYTDKTQNFTVQGDDSVDFVLEHYLRPDGEAAFQVDGVYNFENGTLIIDSATAYHAVNIGESVSEIVANKDKVMHFGDDRPEDFWNDYATLQVVDSKVVSIDGISVMENIKGDVTVHGIGDITINGSEFFVDGDDDFNVIVSGGKANSVVGISDGSTIISTGGATSITTDEEGEFTFGEQKFTIEGDDSATFILDKNNSVIGVNGLENGILTFDTNTSEIAINGNDKVTLTTESDVSLVLADGKITSVDGANTLNGYVSNEVTVHGTGDIQINKGKVFVAGDDDFNVVFAEDESSTIYGFEDGATLNVNVVTTVVFSDTGTLSYGFTDTDAGTIEINSSTPVLFNTDKHGNFSSIENLNGTIYIYTAETFDAEHALAARKSALTINGVYIGMDGSTNVSVSGNGDTVTGIGGFENGATITSDVPVVLENDSTVTVNKVTYALSGDKDRVTITGTSVAGLDAGASLSVSRAGTYTVNGTAFEAKADDTFVATAEGVYIYNPNTLPVTTDTATADILTRFDVTATPETVKTGETDLSTETVASAVSLTSGNQSVTFNNRGNNAAIVSENANGLKDIGLGSGGDLVVVEDTGADVTVTTGAGNDTIVNQGTNTYIDMAAGGADKLYALGGSATLDNYHASTGSGLQTEFSDIGAAIENGKIAFRTGEVSLSGATVYVNDSYEDSTLVDFYDINGEEHRVGFTNTEGGSIDLSPMNKSAIIVGSTQRASSIVGSANDDTIYAAAGDTINGGGGDNLVKLSDSRKTNTSGAAIEIPTVRSATTVENFKTGFDAGDDYIRADISIKDVSYVNGDVVIKHDDSKVILKDVGDGDSAEILVDSDTSVIVGRGKTAKVADEVADLYVGRESALDFSDDYERNVNINLAAGVGAVGDHIVAFAGISTITAGGGKTTLIGSSENEAFYAGSNDNSIYGGGGRDTLHGYTGDDKNGSTEFFFTEDRATITGFEFTGSDINPDKINTGAQGVAGVGVNGDDVYVELFNGGRLKIDGAAGKDFAIANDYDDVVAQISGGDLTYDGVADYFSTTTKSRAKLEVSSEVDNAEVWLNNDERGNAKFYGNIYELDGSAVEGNATLVGNDFDNVITAGKGHSSLWGGASTSNDTLIGGEGRDLFWYEMGNGNDVIQGASSSDSVNLYGVTVDMLTTEVTADSVTLKFNNGQTLKLDTNDGTTFQLADGSNWIYDKSDSSWKTK